MDQTCGRQTISFTVDNVPVSWPTPVETSDEITWSEFPVDWATTKECKTCTPIGTYIITLAPTSETSADKYTIGVDRSITVNGVTETTDTGYDFWYVTSICETATWSSATFTVSPTSSTIYYGVSAVYTINKVGDNFGYNGDGSYFCGDRTIELDSEWDTYMTLTQDTTTATLTILLTDASSATIDLTLY